MNRKKLNLESLKLKSFVTQFPEGADQTVKGGGEPSIYCSGATNVQNTWCTCPIH